VAVALWLTILLIISAVAEEAQGKVLQLTGKVHFAEKVAAALKEEQAGLHLLTM